MQTVNGKLINIERGRLDIVRRQTGEISKRCENLQQQLSSVKQGNEHRDAVCLQEINAVKAYLAVLNKKLTEVEEVAAKQAKNLVVVKSYSFWSFVFISLLLGMNIQSYFNKPQPQIHANNVKTVELASLPALNKRTGKDARSTR